MKSLKQKMLKQKFAEMKAMGATEVSFGSDFFVDPVVFNFGDFVFVVIPKDKLKK